MTTLRAWLRENNAFSWTMRACGAGNVMVGLYGMSQNYLLGFVSLAIGVGLLAMDWATQRMRIIAAEIKKTAIRIANDKASLEIVQRDIGRSIEANMSKIIEQVKANYEEFQKNPQQPPQ